MFGGPFIFNCRVLGMFGDTLVDPGWEGFGERYSCGSRSDVQVQGQSFICL